MKAIKHNCSEELQFLALRATPARIAIMQLLESTTEPVDVATIVEYLDNKHIQTDPATVFRIMNIFTDKRLARKIQFFEGKVRYELATKKDHHHLICKVCGKVGDIEDTIVPKFIEKIETKYGFLVQSHSLEFFGLCKDCQK